MRIWYVGQARSDVYVPSIDATTRFGESLDVEDEDLALSLLEQDIWSIDEPEE